MASAVFDLMTPPVFAICDDVRVEVGGKIILIGVYPAHTIVLGGYPQQTIVRAWSTGIAKKEGTVKGQCRVVRQSDGVVVFESAIQLMLSLRSYSTPFAFTCSFQVVAAAQYSAQVKMEGDSEWQELGKFTITSRAEVDAALDKKVGL